MKDPYKVVHTVLVTEKGTELTGAHNQYCFKVAPDANKIEIRRAVESLFQVKVGAVNVMNREGKAKRLRFGKYGHRASWKKAIVTLKEGSIQII